MLAYQTLKDSLFDAVIHYNDSYAYRKAKQDPINYLDNLKKEQKEVEKGLKSLRATRVVLLIISLLLSGAVIYAITQNKLVSLFYMDSGRINILLPYLGILPTQIIQLRISKLNLVFRKDLVKLIFMLDHKNQTYDKNQVLGFLADQWDRVSSSKTTQSFLVSEPVNETDIQQEEENLIQQKNKYLKYTYIIGFVTALCLVAGIVGLFFSSTVFIQTIGEEWMYFLILMAFPLIIFATHFYFRHYAFKHAIRLLNLFRLAMQKQDEESPTT